MNRAITLTSLQSSVRQGTLLLKRRKSAATRRLVARTVPRRRFFTRALSRTGSGTPGNPSALSPCQSRFPLDRSPQRAFVLPSRFFSLALPFPYFPPLVFIPFHVSILPARVYTRTHTRLFQACPSSTSVEQRFILHSFGRALFLRWKSFLRPSITLMNALRGTGKRGSENAPARHNYLHSARPRLSPRIQWKRVRAGFRRGFSTFTRALSRSCWSAVFGHFGGAGLRGVAARFWELGVVCWILLFWEAKGSCC